MVISSFSQNELINILIEILGNQHNKQKYGWEYTFLFYFLLLRVDECLLWILILNTGYGTYLSRVGTCLSKKDTVVFESKLDSLCNYVSWLLTYIIKLYGIYKLLWVILYFFFTVWSRYTPTFFLFDWLYRFIDDLKLFSYW